MGEENRSAKRRRICAESAETTQVNATDADPSVDASVASRKLLSKRHEVQRERQRQVAEANRRLKREKRQQRVKKQKPARPAAVKKATPEYAVAYARQWKEDRAGWKFQTLVQSWLLHHLLDDEKISKADFPLVLEYLASVRGAARHRLAEEMRAVVEARDRWPSLRAEGQTREQVRDAVGRDKPSKRAYRRARSLLQSLDEE